MTLLPYEKTVLENGITVITESIDTVRSVALGVWIKHGSRSEKTATMGIAHFLEHLVFKGTSNRTGFEIAHALERLGGSINAYTAKENTVYYAHFLDEHLPVAVDVLSDLLSHATFDPEDIEKEKEVIAEEIKSTYDIPDEVCHDAFLESLYPNHSLGWSILGDKKQISRYQQDDFVNFWRSHYSGKDMLVVAAGNMQHNQLVDLVNNFFEPPGDNTTIRLTPLINGPIQSKKIFMNTAQAHVCLGRRVCSFADNDKYPLAVLSTYLGGGMSSLLFQKIREQLSMAYSIYTFTDFYRDTGNFGIYFATDTSRKEEALSSIFNVFDKIKRDGILTETLTDIKNQLKGELLLGLENTQSRMAHIAKSEIYLGLDQTIEDIIERVELISVSDVMQIAEVVLEPMGLTSVQVLPN